MRKNSNLDGNRDHLLNLFVLLINKKEQKTKKYQTYVSFSPVFELQLTSSFRKLLEALGKYRPRPKFDFFLKIF